MVAMARSAARCLLRILSSRIFATVLFVLILLATLTAGLWPFHAPANDAKYMAEDKGIRFNQEGTAISEGILNAGATRDGPFTLELWLKPASTWTSGTILDFYNPERKKQFALSQDGADLLLRRVEHGTRGIRREQLLVVRDAFRRSEFLLTVSSAAGKTVVYIAGQVVLDAPGFRLSNEDLAGRLILGNAPRRSDGWAGAVKGLAVYAAELSARDVLQHGQEWKINGCPTVNAGQRSLAIYVFDRPWNGRIANAVAGGAGLEVPEKLQVVDQLRFESATSERLFDESYRDDAILNILGFCPLGIAATWFWSTLLRRRTAMVAALVSGVGTSFLIEYLQSYLPTRYSGTTDLITNSLGTCLGVAAFIAAAWFLAKKKWVEHADAQPV